MMKSRKPLLSALAAGTLLFAGSLIAQQDMPPQTPPPPPTDTAPQPMPPQTVPPTPPTPPTPATPPTPPAPPSSSMPETPPAADMAGAATGQTDTATVNTPQGQVEVRSSMPPPPPAGPAPSFEQLSGGGKYISEEQASAYPLLANDFLHADRNRDGRISKSEYKRWTDND